MKHTKRIAALLLALALCVSCAACSKTVGSYRVVKTLGTEQFRIGFRDGDQAAVYVNAALKVLAADGTIHSLALKWFGTDDTTFDSDANALDALGDIPQRTFIMGLNEERFPMSYADGDGYPRNVNEIQRQLVVELGEPLRLVASFLESHPSVVPGNNGAPEERQADEHGDPACNWASFRCGSRVRAYWGDGCIRFGHSTSPPV